MNMSGTLGSLTEIINPDSPYKEVGAPAYRMSKTLLNAMTVLFARELQRSNILVNAAARAGCAWTWEGPRPPSFLRRPLKIRRPPPVIPILRFDRSDPRWTQFRWQMGQIVLHKRVRTIFDEQETTFKVVHESAELEAWIIQVRWTWLRLRSRIVKIPSLFRNSGTCAADRIHPRRFPWFLRSDCICT